MKRKKAKGLSPLSLIYACLIYLFLYLPILMVIAYSFNENETNITYSGFSLAAYASVLGGSDLMDSLIFTLQLAFYSTAISLVIGTLATIGMHRYQFRGKKIINNMLYIPIVIPELVIGIASLASFTMMGLELSMVTLVIAHVTFCLPFVIITLRARIAGFDASIEEAAMDLGANQWRTLKRVTIPMLAPGIIAGAMLSFTLSIDDVVISFFVSGAGNTTFPIKVYGMARGKITTEVYALSTVMILGTILIYLTAQTLQKRLEKKQKLWN
ncbi:MAG: ABC transporter permease [Clostridiales bacterium]|nr:ABC transporter permease [Clostridiales bacterium]